jgi:aminoacylase
VPDEELGGAEGMGKLVDTPEFSAMGPVGLALDEGLANPGEKYTVFYGERNPWWIMVRSTGPTGHGSRFIKNTAPMKLLRVGARALAYRADQEALLGLDSLGCHGHKHGISKKLGDVTTVNLTMLKTGVTLDGGKTWCLNVIPTEAEAGFDVRLSPDLKPKDFEALLNQWCEEEEGVSWNFAPWSVPCKQHFVTATDDSNPWWAAFRDALGALGHTAEPEVFPAATDSRFLRQKGIRALGFSPMKGCPILLHEHDEYIPVDVFMYGIGVYEGLISSLASTSALPEEGESPQKRRRVDGSEQEV